MEKPNYKGIVQARLIGLKEALKNRKDYILVDNIQATLDLVAKI